VSDFYANITLQGPTQSEVVAFLNAAREVAYVSPTLGGATVVYAEDFSAQENLAAELSRRFRCPALLVLTCGVPVLLYQLYANSQLADSYVSPHDEHYAGLDDAEEPHPTGDAQLLCETFGIDLPHQVARVERILRKTTDPNRGYALAVNRHGELAQALKLPMFAVGAGFQAIEIGEPPAALGFDAARMVKTGKA